MKWLISFPSLNAITVGSDRICETYSVTELKAKRKTYLIFLCELKFLVSVDGDQVKRAFARSLDTGVFSELLQYGRDHLAWSAPAERQIRSDLATRERAVTNSA